MRRFGLKCKKDPDCCFKKSPYFSSVSPNPWQRVNVWAITIGQGFTWLSLFTQQPSLMRFRAVGTEANAKKMVTLSSIGIIFLTGLATCAGIVVYAYYSHIGCGPMAAGNIYNSNQVVSYFVADVLDFPGIPGLFMAALIAATFSTVSSSQNAISAILWQDMLAPHTKGILDARKTLLMKLTVVVFGLLSTVVAFMSKGLGSSLVQVASILMNVFGGPLFGLYVVGGIFPFVGGKSAFIGTLSSCVVCLLLSAGSSLYGNNWAKPILIDEGCDFNTHLTSLAYGYSNETTTEFNHSLSDDSNAYWKDMLSISPFLYGFLGLAINVLVSTALSMIPGFRHYSTDRLLFFPFISKCASFKKETIFQETISKGLKLSVDIENGKLEANKSNEHETHKLLHLTYEKD